MAAFDVQQQSDSQTAFSDHYLMRAPLSEPLWLQFSHHKQMIEIFLQENKKLLILNCKTELVPHFRYNQVLPVSKSEKKFLINFLKDLNIRLLIFALCYVQD